MALGVQALRVLCSIALPRQAQEAQERFASAEGRVRAVLDFCGELQILAVCSDAPALEGARPPFDIHVSLEGGIGKLCALSLSSITPPRTC